MFKQLKNMLNIMVSKLFAVVLFLYTMYTDYKEILTYLVPADTGTITSLLCVGPA